LLGVHPNHAGRLKNSRSGRVLLADCCHGCRPWRRRRPPDALLGGPLLPCGAVIQGPAHRKLSHHKSLMRSWRPFSHRRWPHLTIDALRAPTEIAKNDVMTQPALNATRSSETSLTSPFHGFRGGAARVRDDIPLREETDHATIFGDVPVLGQPARTTVGGGARTAIYRTWCHAKAEWRRPAQSRRQVRDLPKLMYAPPCTHQRNRGVGRLYWSSTVSDHSCAAIT